MKKDITTGVIILIAGALIASIAGIGVTLKAEDGKVKATIEYSEEQLPATVVDDMGEIIQIEEVNGEEIQTVEEVDGGLFEDATTGMSFEDGEYVGLGATIETFDTSTPEAFKNATLGRCVYANNRFGAQCVSLSRSFWISYANRDVSTCGTGMAKGMMNCAEQNAGDDFLVYWADDKNNIQAGDWLVFNGGQYGHVGMALGPLTAGYVALLGENQGGTPCAGGGAATNVINLSIKNLIGFYRPKAYIKPEPKPEPTPTPEPAPAPVIDECKVRTVKKGDTLGKIMKECLGEVKWGADMNDYAKHWYSTTFKKNLTVYDGWASIYGVGLYAQDTIEYHAD